MSTNEALFIKELKRQMVGFIIGGILTVILTAVGFYYNTKNSLDNIHERYDYIDTRQRSLSDQIQLVNDRKIDKYDVIREFDEVKQLIRDTNLKIDKL